MNRISLVLFSAVVLSVTAAEAQVIVWGQPQYKLSAVSFSKSPSGVVVSASTSPAPPEGAKINLVVFAPSGDTSLSQVSVAGGSYALTMDEVGVYFNFDLKADNGRGTPVGPLIIHELRKGDLSRGAFKLALRHKLAVRKNEPFPTGGRLEVALATEGKGKGGDPQFTIISNSLAGTAK